MEQENAAKRLKAAVSATLGQTRELPDSEIAAILWKTEPELIGELAPGWILAKLASFVRLERSRLEAADPDQMSFPFPDLSMPIETSAGVVELRDATIGILRAYERRLRKKRDQAPVKPNTLLGKVRRQIELMEPYAYRNRRITVAKVIELVEAGTPPLNPAGDMSDSMKRYWGNKTPEERSAIARRRRKRKPAYS